MQENGGMQKGFNTAALALLPPTRPNWMETFVFFLLSLVVCDKHWGKCALSRILSFLLHGSSLPEYLQPPVHQQIAPGVLDMKSADANQPL